MSNRGKGPSEVFMRPLSSKLMKEQKVDSTSKTKNRRHPMTELTQKSFQQLCLRAGIEECSKTVIHTLRCFMLSRLEGYLRPAATLSQLKGLYGIDMSQIIAGVKLTSGKIIVGAVPRRKVKLGRNKGQAKKTKSVENMDPPTSHEDFSTENER